MTEVIGRYYDRLTNGDVSYEAYVNWSLRKLGYKSAIYSQGLCV